MGQLEDAKMNFSIRKAMITLFMVVMVITIGLIGALVFSSWLSSEKETTKNIARELNEQIAGQIFSYLHLPEQINESNHKIISRGILDLADEKSGEKFFTGVLDSYENQIYSFSLGTVNGEYYGARRNEKGVMEIMINNSSTGGNSWYYAVNDDFTAGERVVKAGKFDPRTRDWYQAAIMEDGPAFSAIYKHFIMEDLTISHARPVYNEEGVLLGVMGSHMLLDDIGAYLEETVSDYKGYALIFEKESNRLIANSLGEDNFTVLEDGTLERHTLSQMQNPYIEDVYAQYKKDHQSSFLHRGNNENLFVNVKEIDIPGLGWLVISAIPENYLIAPTIKTIYWAAIATVLLLLGSFIVYTKIAGRLLVPISTLLKTTAAFSSGDLTQRVEIVRNDEIGKISESFNEAAERIEFLVKDLETAVKERTKDLHLANKIVEEKKDQLRLILDSAAEAIFGIDPEGNCTFCNRSSVKLLGYEEQDELLGQNMHQQIHHTHRNGAAFQVGDCRILKVFDTGVGTHAEDEVFWRADGSSFAVEYFSYPQVKDGQIIGVVVTFMDISDRKLKDEQIQYLSCHDQLTGLYNRGCFEKLRKELDQPENLPLSLIFADINGLKMANDIFGHGAGDQMIIQTAAILRRACRENDIVARVGGDEFIILLPKTSQKGAESVLARIREGFTDVYVRGIKSSISLGLATKSSPEQSLEEVISHAENNMYREKTSNRKLINKDIIETIIDTLHSRDPREKEHSINVGQLSVQIGKALQLSERELRSLKRAGFFHDIGKIALDEHLLPVGALDDENAEAIQQYAMAGYRILSLGDDTLDVAEYVYAMNERWDGTGYPRGLKGEEIPLLSRIVAVAEAYDRLLYEGEQPMAERKRAVLETIEKAAGTQFDPRIVKIFLQIMSD